MNWTISNVTGYFWLKSSEDNGNDSRYFMLDRDGRAADFFGVTALLQSSDCMIQKLSIQGKPQLDLVSQILAQFIGAMLGMNHTSGS